MPIKPDLKPIGATGIIAVDVVFAQSTVNLPITVKRGESYEGLLTRASQLAEKTIISRFNQQQGINKIDLLITAEKSGAIAPLLAVKVSRQDWFGNPNIQRWTNVFPFGGLGGLAIAAFLFPSFGFSGLEELGFFFRIGLAGEGFSDSVVF